MNGILPESLSSSSGVTLIMPTSANKHAHIEKRCGSPIRDQTQGPQKNAKYILQTY